MVVTFSVVLYSNQLSLEFILHLFELHIGSSIRYKHTLFGNNFLKNNKVKIILYPSIVFLSIYHVRVTYTPYTPLSYSKTGVFRGIHFFLFLL